jgi:luciferase family oxidoreductase group 1
MDKPVTLSVLDIVPLRHGSNASEAFAETLALARHTESLGYHRYWFAEHHGMPGVASSSPALLAGQVGAVTQKIRIGSGGVMLPNHSPLIIAEQFGTLEALFPGRVDLGLGRAPGTDRATAAVLRRTPSAAIDDEFPHQLSELLHFFRGDFPASHPYQKIQAIPALGNEPPIWLLGSSGYSAQLAGRLGLPFSFAHHFSQGYTLPALELYRANFKPSSVLSKPKVMLGVIAVVADTDKEARRLALPGALSFIRLQRNMPGPQPTIEQTEAHPWSFAEKSFAEEWLASHIIGSPITAKRKLNNLLDDTGADELTVLCMAPDAEARRRSYTLLRELVPTSESA